MNRDTAYAIADYATLVAEKFGDRLASIATFNEPWCITVLSHFLGAHAPRYRDIRVTARARHHVSLAHGLGIQVMRAAGIHDRLGIAAISKNAIRPLTAPTMSRLLPWAMRSSTSSFSMTFFAAPIPKKSPLFSNPICLKIGAMTSPTLCKKLDWIGINYYTRFLYSAAPEVPVFPFKQARGPLEKTNVGWEIIPEALNEFLVRVSDRYPGLPIYVTESGASLTDETKRIAFFSRHFDAMLEVKRRGVDLHGNMVWTLIDNLEWAEGFTPKFGLVGMDPKTLERQPQESYRAFQQMLAK